MRIVERPLTPEPSGRLPGCACRSATRSRPNPRAAALSRYAGVKGRHRRGSSARTNCRPSSPRRPTRALHASHGREADGEEQRRASRHDTLTPAHSREALVLRRARLLLIARADRDGWHASARPEVPVGVRVPSRRERYPDGDRRRDARTGAPIASAEAARRRGRRRHVTSRVHPLSAGVAQPLPQASTRRSACAPARPCASSSDPRCAAGAPPRRAGRAYARAARSGPSAHRHAGPRRCRPSRSAN